jgi:hypothetical protein
VVVVCRAHSIWPDTVYMVVQVGRTVWPDQLENKKHTLFVAPERFGDTAATQPPYPTVPWYPPPTLCSTCARCCICALPLPAPSPHPAVPW